MRTLEGNVLFAVLSYTVVILTLLKPSFEGKRRKAFSTISFHILVVTLFYGSVAGMYLAPDGENQRETAKAITLFYTSATPFLNPMIYCLRNDQVKEALRRLSKRKQLMAAIPHSINGVHHHPLLVCFAYRQPLLQCRSAAAAMGHYPKPLTDVA
ncbi:UNVERIFIED_CONTAM: hypothetical protein K2H54_035094 [Gekko kuhli]